ncbi:MAG: hypothetical protein QOH81_1376 [Sphingomonadales bacterium]|jgi:hypothetical protein|nr:hypothetical protein [Sphingomonadales bacterium]
MADEQHPLNLPPHLPEIFVDEAAQFFLLNGVLRITFASVRPDEKGGPVRTATARIAMPVRGGQKFAIGLWDFLKKQGLDPAKLVTSPGQSPQ